MGSTLGKKASLESCLVDDDVIELKDVLTELPKKQTLLNSNGKRNREDGGEYAIEHVDSSDNIKEARPLYNRKAKKRKVDDEKDILLGDVYELEIESSIEERRQPKTRQSLAINTQSIEWTKEFGFYDVFKAMIEKAAHDISSDIEKIETMDQADQVVLSITWKDIIEFDEQVLSDITKLAPPHLRWVRLDAVSLCEGRNEEPLVCPYSILNLYFFKFATVVRH